MKKLLSLLIVIALLTSMFAGCQSDNKSGANVSENMEEASNEDDGEKEPTESEEEWVLGEDPLEFSFYVNYDWYAPVGFGSTQATKWLQEYMNVTITEISSNGQAAQKFGAMVSSNDLPDVIQMDRGSQFKSLAEAGSLVAIDDYMEKYPHYKSQVDPQAVAMGTTFDGKTYGLLNWYTGEDAPKTNNKGWLVNKKIYKELGEPTLETMDDLYEYLELVEKTYDDVVPLDTANTSGGVIQVQNMIYPGMAPERFINWAKSDETFAVPNFDNKTFTSIFEDEAFKDSYIWTNRLFQNKLLTQDAFTQTIDQFKEKMNTGRVAVAGVYDAPRHGDVANQLLGDEGYMYIDFPVKEGMSKEDVVIEGIGTLGWNVNAITTNAEHPERIYAFLDWLVSEEGIRFMNFGPQGILWDEVDENGAPIPNDTYENMDPAELESYKLGSFKPQGTYVYSIIMNARAAQNPENITFQADASNFYGQYSKVIGNELAGTNDFPAESEEAIIWNEIKTINEEYSAIVTFAKSEEEFNQTFSEWEQRVMDAGYEKILTFMNNKWAENLSAIQ